MSKNAVDDGFLGGESSAAVAEKGRNGYLWEEEMMVMIKATGNGNGKSPAGRERVDTKSGNKEMLH